MNKQERIFNYLKKLDSVALAFSGGVDSVLVAKMAKEALGEKAVAITIKTPYVAKSEIEDSIKFAKIIGIKQVFVESGIIEEIKNNPKDRCYLCKKKLFSKIQEEAKKLGLKHIIDGSNLDDLGEVRPGLKALKELKVISPLIETGFTKADVRMLSKQLNLETYNKPSYACLLTRIPHNEPLTLEKIKRIEMAEAFLHSHGLLDIRVRHHGNLARIEVKREIRNKLFDEKLLDLIDKKFKELGYKYVTIDAYGYRSGGYSEEIKG
jgi:uncharacterized protein